MENDENILVKLTHEEYKKAIQLTKNLYPEYNEDFHNEYNGYNDKNYSEFYKSISNIPKPELKDIILYLAMSSSLYGSSNTLAIDPESSLTEIRTTPLEPITKYTKIKLIPIDPIIKIPLEKFEERGFWSLLKHRKIEFLSNLKILGDGNAQKGIRKLINSQYNRYEGGFIV